MSDNGGGEYSLRGPKASAPGYVYAQMATDVQKPVHLLQIVDETALRMLTLQWARDDGARGEPIADTVDRAAKYFAALRGINV